MVPFQDLPITDEETFDPSGRGMAAVENDILGSMDSPDWDRYKKAHLWFDPDNKESKAGYKFIIARIVSGQLKVIWRQLVAAVSVLNGGRGGAAVPIEEKRKMFNHAMRYYAKMGIEPKDRPSFKGAAKYTPGFGNPVRMFAVETAANIDDSPKWVQVAQEGDFPGYRRGTMPFSLTRQMFEQMVSNFRSNPSYAVGGDGVGNTRVVPWDFHHASEMDPTTGVIPATGVPAQGWAYELEIRFSENGKSQLWALTEFLEPARSYIRDGRYLWASISVDPDAIDDATGSKIGALLTSIAITNQPVVKGMEKLVASGSVSAGHHIWVDPAGDAEDALEQLKIIFGLPATSTIAEVTGELAKFRQFVSGVVREPGIDIDEIIGAMRRLFNLPALATVDDVMGEVDKMIAVVVNGQTVQPVTAPAAAMAASTANNNKESDVTILKILANRLGVREADDAVEAAVGNLVSLQVGVKKLFGEDTDSSDKILQAVERAVSDSSIAKKKLTAILQALGVEDPNAAVNRVADLIKQAKELTSAMPELEKLRVQVKKQEEEQAAADVDAVIASRGYDANLRPALLMFRTSDPVKFSETYPKQTVGANDQQLLTSVVLSQPASRGTAPTPQTTSMPNTINLAVYPGRNKSERAINYVKATVPGSEQWSFEQLCKTAFDITKQPNVIDQRGV